MFTWRNNDVFDVHIHFQIGFWNIKSTCSETSNVVVCEGSCPSVIIHRCVDLNHSRVIVSMNKTYVLDMVSSRNLNPMGGLL